MAEYFEKETVLKEIFSIYEREFPTASGAFDEFVTKTIPNILTCIPIADVAPVGRGHWLDVGCYDIGFWQCSCCGFLSEAIAAPKLYKYCPNCGKKMETNNYEERN